MRALFDSDELILSLSYADSLSMLHSGFPFGVRMYDVELVFSFVAVVAVPVHVSDNVAWKDRCGFHEVCAGAVEGHRVERCCNPEVRNNCCVIVVPTVAVRRHVHYETDMEVGLVLDDSQCILGNLVVESL